MESMQYGETLVKEFLLYRGFSSTLRSFEEELLADSSHGFQVDKVVELLFFVYVPKFEADKLRSLMVSLKQSLLPRVETHFQGTLRKLESSLNRYYIVHAVQKGRADRVIDFFEKYGDLLLQSGDDWGGWFAIPYMKNPSVDARFHVYFTKEWLDTLMVSFRNFLSEVFDGIHLPSLLRFHGERVKVRAMKQELGQLQERCLQLERDLEAASSSRRPSSSSIRDQLNFQRLSSGKSLSDYTRARGSLTTSASSTSQQLVLASKPYSGTQYESSEDEQLTFKDELALVPWQTELFDKEASDLMGISSGGVVSDYSASSLSEEETVPEVHIESQELYAGHTSAITRCRFSASGANIASASVDGTVRIWAPDTLHGSSSRNATIYCGSEVLSLEWEFKSDRLLLLGTSVGGIKVWNVEGKRVVCNLLSNADFPRVLDLKCSPTDPIFVSAGASEGHHGDGIEAMGFGSLTVWNMRLWKPVNLLPLGQDPPAVTSVCFNHNGKIVAAGATDGMIRLFDMNGFQPITGWPVNDSCPVSCVRFGHDQASIWSLSSDGKLVEWSIHNQGQILQAIDTSSSVTSLKTSTVPRHEFALDALGKRVLVTSSQNYASMYSLGRRLKAQKTVEQTGAITSVDWHPIQAVYATGSADHSVQVATIR